MNTISIKITIELVKQAFRDALEKSSLSKTDFFNDIRDEFKNRLSALLIDAGIVVNKNIYVGNIDYKKYTQHDTSNSKMDINIKLCMGYGHDVYSLTSINYKAVDNNLNSMLPFKSNEYFSIGNILVFVKNDDYHIDVSMDDRIYATGIIQNISKKKPKSYIAIFGLHFEKDIINEFIVDKEECSHDIKYLDEFALSSSLHYPVIFICRKCGQLIVCTCFQGYYDPMESFNNKILFKHLEKIIYMKDICSICTGKVPSIQYGSEMYFSIFMQKYLPYHALLSRKKYGYELYEGDKFKELENELRDFFGFPKIGQKLLSETLLYNIVVSLLPNCEIIRHYRGKELLRLEIDIWIPKYKLAIEYQGIQHFKDFEYLGGKEALQHRIDLDNKKKKICTELGYSLVEFFYDDDLTSQYVYKQIESYIQI